MMILSSGIVLNLNLYKFIIQQIVITYTLAKQNCPLSNYTSEWYFFSIKTNCLEHFTERCSKQVRVPLSTPKRSLHCLWKISASSIASYHEIWSLLNQQEGINVLRGGNILHKVNHCLNRNSLPLKYLNPFLLISLSLSTFNGWNRNAWI